MVCDRDAAMTELKRITVKSNLPDKTRVALWEVHADHPNGEVYIADDQAHEVAVTRRVQAALGRGWLVEASETPETLMNAAEAEAAEIEPVEAKPKKFKRS